MRIALPNGLRDAQRLAYLLGASCACVRPSFSICGIATHSGEVQKGDLFVCLSGTRTNGAAYIGEAVENGAAAILAAQDALQEFRVPTFYCDDVVGALLRAAAAYRKEIAARVIAVTGSCGKTTVKEAIAAVLGNVPHSEGNFNSRIGMPLSVLSMPSASHWVLELGINACGEMREMAEALSPDVAVITNVGSAHIGAFGDFSTLLSEKLEIAHALGKEGVLILPEQLPAATLHASCRVVRVGDAAGDAVTCKKRESEAGICCDLSFGDRCVTDLCWPIPLQIGASVIGLAGAVGILEGRSDEEIRQGLLVAGARTPRLRRESVGECIFLDDCYNASPEAMITSLEVLAKIGEGRPLVAVLGDMAELGAYAAALHDAVGAFAAKLPLFTLYTYGKEAMAIADGAARMGMSRDHIRRYHEHERAALIDALMEELPTDAAVLYKASHKMAMADILQAVKEGIV